MVRATVDARLTADAPRLLVEQLRLRIPALRVVAPDAAQRTALHEDGCADAWPVVDGVALDVEDEWQLNTHCSLCGR